MVHKGSSAKSALGPRHLETGLNPTDTGPVTGPLVSIVVPTYNRADMLPRAVHAALRQTHRQLEVIVVNDGSSDGTADVMNGLADTDARVATYTKRNGGIADTLNFGFARARGGYLTWTSDDNWYEEDAIQGLVEFLEGHPEVAFAYTDMKAVDAHANVTGIMQASDPKDIFGTGYLSACFLYRREVMEQVGTYDPRWPRSQDRDFWIRVSRRFRMERIAATPYRYLRHDESMSGDTEAIMLENARLLAVHSESWRQKRRVKIDVYRQLAKYMWNRSRYWRCLYYLVKAGLLGSPQPIRAGACLRAACYASASTSIRNT